jgi:hypothetical protein
MEQYLLSAMSPFTQILQGHHLISFMTGESKHIFKENVVLTSNLKIFLQSLERSGVLLLTISSIVLTTKVDKFAKSLDFT